MPNLVADVRALSAGQYVHLVIYGSTAIGDGGGGFYVWNAAATNADDGAAWIKPTAVAPEDPGRWQRVWTLPVLLTTFGQDLIDSADAAAARAVLALGALATLASVDLTANVSNTLPIGNGGTGQTTAATAFTALKQAASETETGVVELATNAEVATGTDTARAVTPAGAASRYQPLDATLTAWAAITGAANTLAYFSGADTTATTTLTAFGRSLIDDADAAAGRTTLELGAVATLASVNLSSNVTGTLPISSVGNLSIVTETGTSRTYAASDRNSWVRHTNTSAKTGTINTGIAAAGDTWQGINAAATGNLTFVQGSGFTLTGSLIFAPGKSYTLFFTSSSAADVIGGSAT